jgi:hypothetical protein
MSATALARASRRAQVLVASEHSARSGRECRSLQRAEARTVLDKGLALFDNNALRGSLQFMPGECRLAIRAAIKGCLTGAGAAHS